MFKTDRIDVADEVEVAGEGGVAGDPHDPYRDPLGPVRPKLTARLVLEQKRTPSLRALAAVAAARRAREVGAALALVGLVPVVAAGLVAGLGERSLPGLATLAFVAMGAVALVGWQVAARMLRARMASTLRARLLPSDDPLRDLERLERDDAGAALLAEARRRGTLSLVLPMVAVSLLAPLTLHLPVALVLFSERGLHHTLAEFDKWMLYSAVLVLHCHLLLGGLAWRFVRRLARGQVHFTEGSAAGMGALGWVTLASLMPGVFLIGIPTGVVAITGLVFVPLMFRVAGETWAREEQVIAALSPPR